MGTMAHVTALVPTARGVDHRTARHGPAGNQHSGTDLMGRYDTNACDGLGAAQGPRHGRVRDASHGLLDRQPYTPRMIIEGAWPTSGARPGQRRRT
jgi:hypothetical protein